MCLRRHHSVVHDGASNVYAAKKYFKLTPPKGEKLSRPGLEPNASYTEAQRLTELIGSRMSPARRECGYSGAADGFH